MTTAVDLYALPASSTLGKHMLGNAVCPPMIAEILREVLGEQRQRVAA